MGVWAPDLETGRIDVRAKKLSLSLNPLPAIVIVVVLVIDSFSAVRKNPASFSPWALP
jgi:hypothetical protein